MVLDVSKFAWRHPGGKKIIMDQVGGHDSAAEYIKYHSQHSLKMFKEYCIGRHHPPAKKPS